MVEAQYRICIFCFLSAPNSPKTKSGANGKFLPKPLLFHLRHSNSKTNEPKFCKILFLQKLYTFHILNTKCSRSCESVPHFLTPKNCFAKTSSALVPPPARILGGQITKEKCPFLFRRKNRSRANPKSKEHFSLVSAEALRGGGGTVHSFSFFSKKVRANAKITPPNETCSELRKWSDFAGAKIALSNFSKPFPPTAEAVNSQSSPQLKS